MRVYTATMKTSSGTGPKTFAYITTPSTMVAKILSAAVVAPDDDVNEQMDISIHKITSLGTPTATTITPTKHENGDAAAASTVKMDVTGSEPTYDSANTNVVGREGAPSLGGWRYQPSKGEELVIPPSTSWGIRLNTAFGTSRAVTVRLTFGEIG